VVKVAELRMGIIAQCQLNGTRQKTERVRNAIQRSTGEKQNGALQKNACARKKLKKNNFRKVWQSSHTSKSGRLLHMLNAEVSTQADPGTAASQTFPASG